MNSADESSKHLPALEGVNVVQWGDSVACGYAAKMLADFGARVVRLQARVPVADTTIHSHVNASKETVDCDPLEADERSDFDALLGQADLLLEDHAPGLLVHNGLDPAQLRLSHPHLIVVSITPFGQSGPYRDWKANDRELSFLAGLAHLTPRDIAQVGDGAGQPPLGMRADWRDTSSFRKSSIPRMALDRPACDSSLKKRQCLETEAPSSGNRTPSARSMPGCGHWG